MEFLLLIALICFGFACLKAMQWRQNFLIAQHGYNWYIQYSLRWKRKREACLKRFGYRCAVCNSPHELQAHHRTYKRLYCEDQDDLTCLCRVCHAKAPKSDGLYIDFKPTPASWLECFGKLFYE